MGRVPVGLAQAVVAAVQVAPFERRLALELLDEVAMPVEPAQEGRQALALALEPGGVQAIAVRVACTTSRSPRLPWAR